MSDRVVIGYRNHRGEFAFRTITPTGVYYGTNRYHQGEQWLLEAWDLGKKDYRDFAMKDIVSWRPVDAPHSPDLPDIPEVSAVTEAAHAFLVNRDGVSLSRLFKAILSVPIASMPDSFSVDFQQEKKNEQD